MERDITLGSCRKQALEQLGTVEGLDVPITLEDHDGLLFPSLEGRETCTAFEAFAPALDARSVVE